MNRLCLTRIALSSLATEKLMTLGYFIERGKPEHPGKKPLGDTKEPTVVIGPSY